MQPTIKPRDGARAARGARRSARRAATVDEAYERIFSAIVEHRLPPGAKLVEDRLSEIFGLTRARVRQVLARLGHERIVTLQPNRGAFVAEPTVDEAREVFEMRKLLEPGIVRRVVARVDAAGIARLRAHVAAEEAARLERDRRPLIRLTGEFHLLLAELAGNALLLSTMRELESITCLVIYLYDAPSAPSCRGNDHAAIIDAIEAKQADRAAAAMLHHLDEIESVLDVHVPEPEELDLEAILGAEP